MDDRSLELVVDAEANSEGNKKMMSGLIVKKARSEREEEVTETPPLSLRSHNHQ